MNIRLATREDLPAILAISNWAALNTPANFAIEPETLESWQASFDQTHRMFPWLVACPAGADGAHGGISDSTTHSILGFAKASPHRSRCAYAWSAEVTVYVHPDHHGQGVGTALYGRLIPILQSQGYATLVAGITEPNPASQQLHEAFGFHRIGAFERIGWKFGRWHDVSYWEAFLRGGDGPPANIRSVAEVCGTISPLPSPA